jgi:hypothetical protein
MRIDRTRRSAKETINDLANELLKRTDGDATAKLQALETIALRMNWNDLYNRLRYRNGRSQTQELQWWQK